MTQPPSADPEAEYYQAIEEFFVSHRGDPLFLSNADWNLVRRWRLAGLPLRVVLRGIRDALDAHAHSWSRQRKVGSLAYCAGEVDVACERWQRALALGSEDEGGGVAAALLGFAGELERAITLGPEAREVALAIALELRELPAAESLERTTALLAEREDRLLEAIARGESPESRAARAAEVDASLAPWRRRMPERVVAQLRRDSLKRRALEAYGLPRLSLFHLEGGGRSE